MNGKGILLLFCFLIQVSVGKSQVWDSISASFRERPKFFLQVDKYNSIVANAGANTTGLKTGLDFAKRVRVGIGYYVMDSDIIEDRILHPDTDPFDTTRVKLKMSYGAGSLEYIFYRKDPWQFSVPVQLGIGSTYFEYYDSTRAVKRLSSKAAVIFEPSVMGQFKFFRFFAIGFGVGARKMLYKDPKIQYDLNSPIYVLRFKILFGEIFKAIFPKRIKKAESGEQKPDG
jgi:hypothetical protein